MHHQDSRPDQESDGEQSEPDRVPVSRWRNRRQWFYVAVVAATLAGLGGGWAWWYRADFPIPSRPFVEPTSPNLMTELVIHLWGQAKARQQDFQVWKVKRETKRLQLAGTIWEGVFTNSIIEFTSEGLFHWREAPWTGLEERPPFAAMESANPASLEGHPWRFLHEVPPNFGFRSAGFIHPPNLEFPGSDWSAYLLFDRHVLFVTFAYPGRNDRHPFPFAFTHQPSPRD